MHWIFPDLLATTFVHAGPSLLIFYKYNLCSHLSVSIALVGELNTYNICG